MRAVRSGLDARAALAAQKYGPEMHLDNRIQCFPSAPKNGALATALKTAGHRR